MRLRAQGWRLSEIIAAGVLVLFVLTALIGSVFVADPLTGDYGALLTPPSAQHWFGTDMYGRDVFARVVVGARYSLGLALVCVSLPALVGGALGTVSGLHAGRIDAVLMRSADMFQAFPEILIGILIVGVVGPGIAPVSVAIVVVMWVRYARLARSLVHDELAQPYIQVARLNGAGSFELVIRYIYPRVLPQFLTAAFMDVGYVMLTLASFSFLGLGVTPPTPEWGALLSEARTYLTTAPYLMVLPGAVLVVAVFCIQTLGSAWVRFWTREESSHE